MRRLTPLLLAVGLAAASCASGCGGTTGPTRGTPFAQVFAGEMTAGGYTEYPVTLEGPGTLRVSLIAEGNDLFFLVTDQNRVCARQDCVPLARMTAEHKLEYQVLGRQELKLIIWHIQNAGETRPYRLDAIFE
jgi:hypothetical protein